MKGIGGFYYVKAEDARMYECKARGILRKEKIKPVIGDRVEITVQGDKGSVDKIYERKNELIRPPVSNIDLLVIVVAAKDPNPDLFLIDKLLVTAQSKNIEPVICINKTDLKSADEIRDIYKNTGYKIFEISADKNIGIAPLYEYLIGKSSAFAGLSGVGKSSTLSLILNRHIETGSVSDKIGRGKHTTRHVELFELEDGGYVLDTPGFSSFEQCNIQAQALCDYFPEMADLKDSCYFKGCSHTGEPDCAVKDAVNNGTISNSRYESYCKLYELSKQLKAWKK